MSHGHKYGEYGDDFLPQIESRCDCSLSLCKVFSNGVFFKISKYINMWSDAKTV